MDVVFFGVVEVLEYVFFSLNEWKELICCGFEMVVGRVLVIVGVLSYLLKMVVEMLIFLVECGVDFV